MENLSLKFYKMPKKTQAERTALIAASASCGQRLFNLAEGFLIPVPNRTEERKRGTGLMHNMNFKKRQVLSWPVADSAALWLHIVISS